MRTLMKRNLFFRTFFLSNLAIFLLPLVIGLISYSSIYGIVESEIRNSNQVMLENAGSVVDKTMEEIENIVSRLALDSQIQSFVSLPTLDTGSARIAHVRDAWLKLSDYKLQLTNNYIIDMAIYSKSCGITISSTIPYSKFPYYYGVMFRYGDLDYSQWKTLSDSYHNYDFLGNAHVEVLGQPHNAIVFMQSLPLGAKNRLRGTLTALIDAEALQKLLTPIQYSPDSIVMILDANGRPLLSTNAGQQVNLAQIADTLRNDDSYKKLRMQGKDYILTSYKSSYSKWTYVAIHPEAVIGQKLIVWKRTITLLAAVCAAIGTLLVIYLSWRNANPISDIYHAVAGISDVPVGASRKRYDFLKGSIAGLIQDQHRLQDKMSQQLPLLQASYLKQLIGNEFISDAEMSAYAQNANLNMDFQSYLCAIVSGYSIGQTDDPGQLQQIGIAMMLIREAIQRRHPNSFILNRGTGQFVLIYCENTRDEDELRRGFQDMIALVVAEVQEQYNIPVRVDAGQPVFKQTDCFQSYQNAVSVSEYHRDNCNGALMWYRDIVGRQESYHFPVETEIQLVNHIREGKTNNVVREIGHLISENLQRRSLSTDKYLQFINTLLLIATRLNEDVDPALQAAIPAAELLMTRSKARSGETLVDLFVGLASRYEEALNSKQGKLHDRVIEFVAARYQDPNLTLYEAATAFSMTESAVYAFFKKHVDMTFADYVESVRIHNACRLLLSGGNINDIAEQVGYTSPHSFRRAFKRIKGVTPTLYKEIMQDNAAFAGRKEA